MKKIVWSAAAAALLSACSSAPQFVLAPGVVSHKSINPVQGESGSYIGSIWFRKPWTQVTPDHLNQCLTSAVHQREVNIEPIETLPEDSGPVTQVDRVAARAGVTESDEKTVIEGVSSTEGAAIAYRLELQLNPTSNYYYFDRIGRAASADSQHFEPVGAWDEADPIQAWTVLNGVANDIQVCLSRYAQNEPEPGNDIIEHDTPIDAIDDLNNTRNGIYRTQGQRGNAVPSGVLQRSGSDSLTDDGLMNDGLDDLNNNGLDSLGSDMTNEGLMDDNLLDSESLR